METVSLEILKNYILSEGGVVSSQQIVRKFQPFLKDPQNKEKNKELFKSYLSTLTDYRHDQGSHLKILELKKEYRTDNYYNTPTTPTLKQQKRPASILKQSSESALDKFSPTSRHHENYRSNRKSPAMYRRNTDSRLPKHLANRSAENMRAPVRTNKPTVRTASINAINMFNKTAPNQNLTVKQPIDNRDSGDDNVFTDKDSNNADTLESGAGEDFNEEMESGCSNFTLEQNEKEWILKSATGDCDTISRLLLQDKNLVYYRDFISGYTGLHWACKLGNTVMCKVLLDAGSELNTRSYSGHTPLHLAARSGNAQVITLLINQGADKEIRDNSGKKAYSFLPNNASIDTKMKLATSEPVKIQNNKNLAPSSMPRKFSKSMTMSMFDNKDDNTPKRHPTLNQAWRKLNAPGFFASRKTQKVKESQKIDSNKRDLSTPREEAKENRKDHRSKTLPSSINKQQALYL